VLRDICSLYFVLCVVFVKTVEGTESKTNFPLWTIKYILSYLILSENMAFNLAIVTIFLKIVTSFFIFTIFFFSFFNLASIETAHQLSE